MAKFSAKTKSQRKKRVQQTQAEQQNSKRQPFLPRTDNQKILYEYCLRETLIVATGPAGSR